MKILHFVSSFNNGGIETMLVNLVNLQIRRHEVGIVVFTDNVLDSLAKRLDSRIRLIKIGKPVGSKNLLYFLKLQREYLRYEPDILHLHDHNATRLFPIKKKKEKRFATIHNMIPTQWDKSVDEYIAISECVKEGFLKQTGKKNCKVIYNGINLSSFPSKEEYPSSPRRFLSIGRLYPSKGMDIVAEAFTKIRARKGINNITLDIWGEGQERKLIETIIEKGGLSETVFLRGNMDSRYVEKHICDYDCVIQASRHEGFGLTAIEAMASGVPTILSDIDGYSEVSKNGEYSTLFRPDNVDNLCEKICEVIIHYDDSIARANKAKKYVLNNYSIETLNNNLEEEYKK